jgi:hypothetical protein
MDLSLRDRRALVGGGASGIGGGVAGAWRAGRAGRADRPHAKFALRRGMRGSAGRPSLPTLPTAGPSVQSARRSPRSRPGPAPRQHPAATGAFISLGEAEWEQAIAGALQSTLRLIVRRCAMGKAGSRSIVLSSSVREPIGLTTSNVLRQARRAGQIADRRDRAGAHQQARAGRIATDRITWLDSQRAAAGDAG